jgi:hypothetical protein
MASHRPLPPRARLSERARRVQPSPDERAWFDFPALTREATRAASDAAARTSSIPSPLREGAIHRQIREIPVADVWYEVDVGDRWRAAFRLVPYAGQPVVAELRVFPRDDWPTRNPGQWRAAFLGLDAGRVVGTREGRTTDRLDRSFSVPRARNTASFAPIQHGITADLLRHIPLGAHARCSRAFIRAVRRQWALTKSYQCPDGSLEPAPEPFPQFPAAPGLAPQRRGPAAWPDVRYARIAAAYVARVETGSRHALADVASASRGTLSIAQVRDAIHTARQRGLLTPTTQQGRPGGQLTRPAEHLLRAEARRRNTRPHAKTRRRR